MIRDRVELREYFTEREADIIVEGNDAVHQGDALIDALMFKDKFRTDAEMLVYAYGLPWEEVLTISK